MGTMKVRTALSRKNKYYISKNRRLELKYFCLQYIEWKEYLKSASYCKSEDEWNDPTSEEAIKRIIFEKNVHIIEDTAVEAGEDIAKFLLLSVTKDLSYVNLHTKYYIPCGKDYYYDRYHKFWFLLSRKLHVL